MDTKQNTPQTVDEANAAPAALRKTETLQEKLDDMTREKLPRHHLYRHKDVNCGQKSFAAGLSLYNLLWVFFAASVLGVFIETLFHRVYWGIWVRTAGMLYGPFNQIYGFGAVLLVVVLYKFRDRNIFVIFLISTAAGMGFEYLCSWAQQILFGSASWNYGQSAVSIGGRTSFEYGVGWGLLGYFFICHFWPWLSEMVGRIPNRAGRPLTIVIAVFLALNMALSAAAVWRAGQRSHHIPAANAVEHWLDATYPDTVIREKYPGMVFADGFG